VTIVSINNKGFTYLFDMRLSPLSNETVILQTIGNGPTRTPPVNPKKAMWVVVPN
jgi:hypothetical protein